MDRFVLITDYAWPNVDIERDVLRKAGAKVIVAKTGEEEELLELAPRADAIITCWKSVNSAVLDAAPHCRIVSRYGIGLDNIAVDHATQLGILVTNVPDYCFDEVSEHAMALLLACARKVAFFSRNTHRGIWDLKAGQPIYRLRGQTLGLLGYGNIARALVPKALGFGMRVIVHDILPPPPETLPEGVTFIPELEALLRESDFVSLHLPLTDSTQRIMNADRLRMMKSSAYLINTSRGGVIDQEALCQALGEGWIAGAALDVMDPEPPPPDHPLLGMDRLIATPHASFYSETSIEELQRRAAEHVAEVFAGRIPPCLVNPNVLKQSNLRAGDIVQST
jgi:D-3-phosphoglycerate dehydrogenase